MSNIDDSMNRHAEILADSNADENKSLTSHEIHTLTENEILDGVELDQLKQLLSKQFNDARFKDCENFDSLLAALLGLIKAKKFVGAGVGGLLINKDQKYVLLYKRYKEPEKDFWSMPGGSVRLGIDCETILVQKFKELVDLEINPKTLKYICVNNHISEVKNTNYYHYLSPAFQVAFQQKFLKAIPLNKQIKKTINIDGKDTEYIVKWEKIDKILQGDLETIKNSYTQTTINALRKFNEVKDLEKEVNNSIEKIRKELNDVIEDRLKKELNKALSAYFNHSTYESTNNH